MPRAKKTEEKTEETQNKVEIKKVSEKEFEKRVLELAEEGLTAEKIGEKLRKEGIHSKEFGKKISHVLGAKYANPDKLNLERKMGKLIQHFSKNKGDRRAMRDKERVSAKLRRLKKYLKAKE